jgi:hypothetical protein
MRAGQVSKWLSVTLSLAISTLYYVYATFRYVSLRFTTVQYVLLRFTIGSVTDYHVVDKPYCQMLSRLEGY